MPELTRLSPLLLLLPGMDGTGDLFADFVASLPEGFEARIVRYPSDVCLSYSDLMGLVRSAAPLDRSFLLVAESFSTPLAIQFAATNPAHLRGLVLCAGFVSSPVRGWRRWVVSILAPILFRFPLSEIACRALLVGSDAPASLATAVRTAVSTVRANVLLDRMRSVLACDVRAELARIDLPILCLQAAEDRLVGGSCLAEISMIQPEADVVAIAGPHLLFQREPERTAEIVAGFFGRI